MTIGALISECWNSQRQPRALRLFLESRGLARSIRALISSLTLVLVSIAWLSLGSPSGAQGAVDRAVVIAVIAGGIGWAVRWNVGRWPSFRESVAFLAFADIAIALACALDANSLAGLSGLGLLVLLGTYATFLLGPRVLVAHVVWCSLAVGVLCVRVAVDPAFDVSIALAKAIMLTVVAVVVPLVVEVGVHIIRVDADRSLTDPLTGLANRRGLDTRLMLLVDDENRRLGRSGPNSSVAAVIVLDLDKFKRINDEFGHNVGDEVLTRVGRELSGATGHSAVISRQGGEEFLIFDLFADRAAALRTAAKVCDAVATSTAEPRVTASVGLAVAPTSTLLSDRRGLSDRLNALIGNGDAAMYRAKKSGGCCVVADADAIESRSGAHTTTHG